MCGLFGVMATRPLQSEAERDKMVRLFNSLAVCSVARGADATGMAILQRDGASLIYKNVLPSTAIVDTRAWRRAQESVTRGTAAILGHTRYGTHGENVPGNAHPFHFEHERYGTLVGMHNGVILNHDELKAPKASPFANDSANLFWALSHLPEQRFREVLEVAYGNFALLFRRRNTLYMTRNDGSPLYVAQLRDLPLYVFASEAKFITEAALVQNVKVTRPKSLPSNKLYAINLLTMRERTMVYTPYEYDDDEDVQQLMVQLEQLVQAEKQKEEEECKTENDAQTWWQKLTKQVGSLL